LPSMVSAFAFTTIKLPTLLNGIIQEAESILKELIEIEYDF